MLYIATYTKVRSVMTTIKSDTPLTSIDMVDVNASTTKSAAMPFRTANPSARTNSTTAAKAHTAVHILLRRCL